MRFDANWTPRRASASRQLGAATKRRGLNRAVALGQVEKIGPVGTDRIG
jgi:hypothetical protein